MVIMSFWLFKPLIYEYSPTTVFKAPLYTQKGIIMKTDCLNVIPLRHLNALICLMPCFRVCLSTWVHIIPYFPEAHQRSQHKRDICSALSASPNSLNTEDDSSTILMSTVLLLGWFVIISTVPYSEVSPRFFCLSNDFSFIFKLKEMFLSYFLGRLIYTMLHRQNNTFLLWSILSALSGRQEYFLFYIRSPSEEHIWSALLSVIALERHLLLLQKVLSVWLEKYLNGKYTF